MAGWTSKARELLRRGIDASNRPMNIGSKISSKVKGWGLKQLHPEISEISRILGERAQKKAYQQAALIGAPIAAAAYLAGRGMQKKAGVMDLFKKKTRLDKTKDFLRALPDNVKEHLMKKVKHPNWHVYAGGAGIGAAGLGAGILAGRAGKKGR